MKWVTGAKRKKDTQHKMWDLMIASPQRGQGLTNDSIAKEGMPTDKIQEVKKNNS